MEPEATKKQSLPYLALLIILVVVGIYFFLNKPVTETSTVTNTVATNIDDGGEESEPATKVIKTGETDTVEFIVDKAGTFEFYCSVGEHRNMGMVGALTVTE